MKTMSENPTKTKETKYYIGKEVEDAIIEFCSLDPDDDRARRNKIFKDTIYPALDTLVQNIIYHGIKIGRPYYCETDYEDLKLETISFLYQKLETFDPNRGKAFSFLNRTAYNYILLHSQNVYKNLQHRDELLVVDSNRDLVLEETRDVSKNNLQLFFVKWTKESMQNLDRLYDNPRDKRIADAILRLFENSNYINIYYKKILMLTIREQVEYPTMYITKVLRELRENFNYKYKAYLRRQI